MRAALQTSVRARRRRAALLFTLLAGAVACGDNHVICTLGEVRLCRCDAASGAQQCVDQGLRWEACRCGDTSLLFCGDARCDPMLGETPATCPVDCARCAPCASDADCAAGSRCGRRTCDGARACYPSDGGGACFYIGDAPRPRACEHQRCEPGSGECGPLADCVARSNGQGAICQRRCRADGDCIGSPMSTAAPACDVTVGRCVLRCSSTLTCPDDLACEPRAGAGMTLCQ